MVAYGLGVYRGWASFAVWLSTETAITAIYDELMHYIDSVKVSVLVLLNLSATFDTVNHNALLKEGLVLGSQAFIDLNNLIDHYHLSHYLYADDTQLIHGVQVLVINVMIDFSMMLKKYTAGVPPDGTKPHEDQGDLVRVGHQLDKDQEWWSGAACWPWRH